MAKREVAIQYAGSLLGVLWTFFHPVALIFIFWIVFSVGYKMRPTHNVPFVVWLTAGMSAWFVFVDIINGSARTIITNSLLVKRTLFPSQILPVITIVSCLITHLVFLSVLGVLIILQKMSFSLYYFQFLYYLLLLCTLALGIGWIVSALNVFIRDIGQIVSVILQIGFWATPVFWDIAIMPHKVQQIVKLNPMFYVVQGYRDSFIYFKPFWQHPYQALFFWTFTLIIFASGALIFKKLKPQFAEAL